MIVDHDGNVVRYSGTAPDLGGRSRPSVVRVLYRRARISPRFVECSASLMSPCSRRRFSWRSASLASAPGEVGATEPGVTSALTGPSSPPPSFTSSLSPFDKVVRLPLETATDCDASRRLDLCTGDGGKLTRVRSTARLPIGRPVPAPVGRKARGRLTHTWGWGGPGPDCRTSR
jgi:hypothetical protein